MADKVGALPYDVMNSAEARDMVKGNPYSFLHVDKAEIDLPEDTYIYDESVYLKARENLDKLSEIGVYKQDSEPCFYIYKQVMNGRSQVGLVGCASIDDYMDGTIKRHENTRADKELDRINHVDYCDANTGPIFLTYRNDKTISTLIESQMEQEPVYNFESSSVQNVVWVISKKEIIEELRVLLDGVSNFYIADGHHRAASAAKVGLKRREENPDYKGDEEFNYFLAVLFPDNELEIMDYNRVVKDLNGLSESEFMDKLSETYELTKLGTQPKDLLRHQVGLYMGDVWYRMQLKDGLCDESDPVGKLDVSILQNRVLSPVLGIDDPTTDKRIDFIGGIRGLDELEKRCHEDMCIAFAMHPTSIDELMDIADAGLLMPPKSTWFEPKLLSGLFVHKLGR
jgi:uncharacterized protein (DUF1015 family)